MANSYEATGRLISVGDVQQVTDSFKKREFVIEIPDGQYPQSVKFQMTQDRCASLDRFKAGQEIKVMFNLRGRPYQKRDGGTDYWLNLEAWRVEEAGAGGGNAGTDYTQIPPAAASSSANDFDDVPF